MSDPERGLSDRNRALLLFSATFVSVFVTYGYGWAEGGLWGPGALGQSLQFTVALLGVLLCHEFAHYLVARRHGFATSLPMFIPFPLAFGTLGAIISLESEPETRAGLIEMGAAGPIAGFVASLVCLVIGLPGTEVVPEAAAIARFEGSEAIAIFANPPIMDIVGEAVLGEKVGKFDVLTPVALAGWVGCFLTAMNMLPVGQLDGGHVLNGLAPDAAGVVSKVFLGLLFVAGALLWVGWAIWGGLLLFTGAHRGVEVPRESRLGGRAVLLGVVAVVAMGASFMPTPIEQLDLLELATP